MTARRAYLELLFASALWGFGFIATRWAMQSFGPLWLQTIRYALVVAVTLPYWLYYRRKHRLSSTKALQLAAVPGLALGATLLFQTYGLQFTTVTKSGFLTTLYVVLVPLIDAVIRRQAPSPAQLGFVLLALVGTALMTGMEAGGAGWNVGDLLTLACAACAAVQIITVGRMANRMRPFEFNFFQSIWSGVIPVILAMGWEPHPHHAVVTPLAVVGILFLAFGSTLLGFQIQIRAQRVISPSLASFFFLLESPFAALFAAFLLSESLSPVQWLGATLIFLSTLGTVWLVKRES